MVHLVQKQHGRWLVEEKSDRSVFFGFVSWCPAENNWREQHCWGPWVKRLAWLDMGGYLLCSKSKACLRTKWPWLHLIWRERSWPQPPKLGLQKWGSSARLLVSLKLWTSQHFHTSADLQAATPHSKYYQRPWAPEGLCVPWSQQWLDDSSISVCLCKDRPKVSFPLAP